MFSLCPNCQFLLARDPRSGRLPAACPKCGSAIVDDDPPPPAEPPVEIGEQPEGHQAATEDPAPPAHHARRPRRRRTEDAAEKPKPAQAATTSPTAADGEFPEADPGGDAEAGADASTNPSSRPGPGRDKDLDLDQQSDLDSDEATTAADSPARPTPDISGDAKADSQQAPGPDTNLAATDAGIADPSDTAPGGPATNEASPRPGHAAQPPPRPPDAHRRRMPSFLQPRGTGVRGPPRETALLWTAVTLLTISLALQLLLADRARLAMDAGWRPTLAQMCGVLGCELPPWREPLAFTMLSRDVRAHPQRPGTLRVTASFRNDARWPQPWPALMLTLSDLDGRVAGARAFAPADYVEADDRDRLLAPRQTATVTLDVVEPAPGIVAFTFDFR